MNKITKRYTGQCRQCAKGLTLTLSKPSDEGEKPGYHIKCSRCETISWVQP